MIKLHGESRAIGIGDSIDKPVEWLKKKLEFAAHKQLKNKSQITQPLALLVPFILQVSNVSNVRKRLLPGSLRVRVTAQNVCAVRMTPRDRTQGLRI